MIVVSRTSPSNSRRNSRHTASRRTGRSSRHSNSRHRTIIHQRLKSMLTTSGGSVHLNGLIRAVRLLAVALATKRRRARGAGRRDDTRGLVMGMMMDDIGIIQKRLKSMLTTSGGSMHLDALIRGARLLAFALATKRRSARGVGRRADTRAQMMEMMMDDNGMIIITKTAGAATTRLALACVAVAACSCTSDADRAAAATTAAARDIMTVAAGSPQRAGRNLETRRPRQRGHGTTKFT